MTCVYCGRDDGAHDRGCPFRYSARRPSSRACMLAAAVACMLACSAAAAAVACMLACSAAAPAPPDAARPRCSEVCGSDVAVCNTAGECVCRPPGRPPVECQGR